MIKSRGQLVALSLSMVFLAGCNVQTENTVKPVVKTVEKVDPMMQSANKALSDAKVANGIVAKKGFDWNVTYKLIKKAEQDIKDGKFKDSIKKSQKARSYALIGLEQVEVSKTAAPRFLK